MRVSTTITLACSANDAWRALHDPLTLVALYAPMLKVHPETEMPSKFVTGTQTRVRLRLLGVVPMGQQLIAITDTDETTSMTRSRTMHDRGKPLSGPLALLQSWHHQMMVSETAGLGNDAAPEVTGQSRARWTDSLQFGGPVAWLAWPVLWCIWKLRAVRIARLSRRW